MDVTDTHNGFGSGSGDPRNASVAARNIAVDLAAVIQAGTRVVQDHVHDCQQAVMLAEARVRKRASERHGGLANAWLYFADPDVLALAAALRRLGERP